MVLANPAYRDLDPAIALTFVQARRCCCDFIRGMLGRVVAAAAAVTVYTALSLLQYTPDVIR